MSKTLYLHIGTPKTGTCSIQEFLETHAEVLRQRSIVAHIPCPLEEKGTWRVRNLIELARKGDDPAAVNAWINRFVRDVEQDQADTMIVSEELLWNVLGNPRRKHFFTRLLSALQQVAEVHVLVYLRRQDNFLMSAYQQRLKSGRMNGLTCRQWIQRHNGIRQTDYRARLEWLLPLVGKEKVLVRAFESSQFFQGSLVADFMKQVGVEIDEHFLVSAKKINVALSPLVSEIIRCLGFFPSDRETVMPLLLLVWAGDDRCVSKDREHRFLSPTERRRILRKHRAGNRWVAKEFLGREDGVLFDDPLPSHGQRWRDYQLNEEEVRSFFKEAQGLDSEQRKELCERVLSVIHYKKTFRGRWRRMRPEISTEIPRKLRKMKNRLRRGIRCTVVPLVKRWIPMRKTKEVGS